MTSVVKLRWALAVVFLVALAIAVCLFTRSLFPLVMAFVTPLLTFVFIRFVLEEK